MFEGEILLKGGQLAILLQAVVYLFPMYFHLFEG
jgi:hypothetical protein